MQAARQMQSEGLREKLVELAFATNTVKTYKSGVKQYLQHAQSSPFKLWSPESIAGWLLHALFNLKWAKNTLRARLSAMAWHVTTVRQEHWDESPGGFVHLMKRAIGRLGSDAQPKLPIKGDKLRLVMELLDTRRLPAELSAKLKLAWTMWSTDQARARTELAAWFAVSFACFLRASETAGLDWNDVQAEVVDNRVKAMQISLRTSQFEVQKTSSTTVHLVIDAADQGVDQAISAVTRLSALVALNSDHLEGKVFQATVENARKCLQILAEAVFGKAAHGFGLHSLRSGAACSADEAGDGIARIMFMGRWRSAAVLAYLRGDADGASALLLRGNRPGQGTQQGEYREL